MGVFAQDLSFVWVVGLHFKHQRWRGIRRTRKENELLVCLTFGKPVYCDRHLYLCGVYLARCVSYSGMENPFPLFAVKSLKDKAASKMHKVKNIKLCAVLQNSGFNGIAYLQILKATKILNLQSPVKAKKEENAAWESFYKPTDINNKELIIVSKIAEVIPHLLLPPY